MTRGKLRPPGTRFAWLEGSIGGLVGNLRTRSGRPLRRPGLSLKGPQLMVLSSAALILAGTIGLKVLPGLHTGRPLGWLDALFTSTSAVCVTGLIVVDTAAYFTPAGQLFILLLISSAGLA